MIPFDRYTTFSTCVIHLLFVVVIYITLLVFKPLMKKKCTCVTVITKTWWRFQTGIPECLQIQPDFESDSPNAFRLLSSGDHRGHSETRVRVSSHRKSSHVSCQGNCTMSPVTRNWYSFCFASNTKSCCREKFAKDFSRKGSTLKKWRKTSMTCQKEWKCPLLIQECSKKSFETKNVLFDSWSCSWCCSSRFSVWFQATLLAYVVRYKTRLLKE